jgi:hypothetical protein
VAVFVAVALVARYSSISFLWHNVVGVVAVVGVGMLISLLDPPSSPKDASQELPAPARSGIAGTATRQTPASRKHLISVSARRLHP